MNILHTIQPDINAATRLLTDVLVLVESFLGNVALLEFHAQLEVQLHDGLVDLLPRPVLLALDDIVQSVKSPLLLIHLDKL